MAAEAGAAAAAAAATASAAFKYNRANYQYDEGAMRFGRYTVGFNMAQAQTKMYREDIEDLTKLTVTKQDTYHTIGTIFFVLNFQLIMAGRLGVHGPSPPGWLLGLYWTNICSALCFLSVFTWMAMHASARATAGSAFMRTRHIRLPIPTPKQLDQARTTGNRFEKQRLAEMLRIPFVMPAPKTTTEGDSPERRVPKWYQEDEVKDLHKGEEGAVSPAEQTNPEHFELHRGLQEEWWGYDIYSRIGVFCFMSHWLSSASLYSMCHIFTELRCIWPAWTVTAAFVASHYGILQLDIVNAQRGGLHWQIEKVLPLVPFFACAGMTIDYSVLNPTKGAQLAVYCLAWIGYIIQALWAIRLYDLAKPSKVQKKDEPERPGRPWVPREWPMPNAFKEAAYIVSAPKKHEDGQICLTQELKAGKDCKGASPNAKTAQSAEPSLHAWTMFRGACITTISMWTLIIFGRVFETVNGERMLLKQEGRVERWPSHIQPWMPPWSRFGTRNEWCHAGGCDRRLSEDSTDVSQMAQSLISVLQPLVDALGPLPTKLPVKVDHIPPIAADLTWPENFHPVHLVASDDESVTALSRDRRGAIVKVKQPFASTEAQIVPFELRGLESHGNVNGGSLTQSGLLVTLDSGMLAECAGSPVLGACHCQPLGPKLPPFGASLKAAVASRVAGADQVRAAMAFQEAGEEGSLLLLETDVDGSTWLPVGEVRLPTVIDQLHLSLSPSGEAVFMSVGSGEVLKWPFGSTEPTEQVPAFPAGLRTTWLSSCPLGDDHVVHLATEPTETAPKLYVRATSA